MDKRLSKKKSSVSKGEYVERFVDMYKSPLGVEQVAEAVVDLSLLNYRGIVHVAGPKLSVYDFTKQAFEALGLDSRFIKPIPINIPNGKGLRDSSLDCSILEKLTGLRPLSVSETLKRGHN